MIAWHRVLVVFPPAFAGGIFFNLFELIFAFKNKRIV